MLSVKNVTKYYGSLRALHDVSFDMDDNEIVGILGPNGSGKTTLLRILTTYFEPSAGRVTVNGGDIFKNPLELRKITGYLPENNILYMNMTVEDYLGFAGKARGLRGKLLSDRMDWCVDVLRLEEALKKRNHECSKGFRQRVALGAALIHDPRIIILDEPTVGLDPIQIIAFREFLRSLSENRLIIISSHVLQEIAALATRIIILHRGKVRGDFLRGGVLEGGRGGGTEELESFFLNAINSAGGAEDNGGGETAREPDGGKDAK